MTALLDANVLIALLLEEHVHHEAARAWRAATNEPFTTCPITEGALVRAVVRQGQSADDAQELLTTLAQHPRYEFWSDSISYRDVPMHGVIGHRQVTDAYLAQLARTQGGRLATFDRGLAAAHQDVVDLVPVP